MNEPLLRITMLGRFTVQLGKTLLPPQAWPQRKTQQLLKLLLTERGRFFMQDQLIEALFSEMDLEKAVLSLHGRISELRRLLEPELKKGTDSQFILHAKLQGYCFSKDSPCWLDTEAFQKFFQDAHEAEQAGRWLQALENYQQAVALYQGDFLSEDLYEEWTLAPRERWRELFLKVLARLADVRARLRQLDRAIECCERALALQPWNESIARQKMLYHYHAGAQALALQTYHQCVEALKTHLQAEPSHELRAVQEQISNGEVAAFPYVYPNSLPSALTSFVGREREIIEVKRLLTDGATGRSPLQTRLLMLTGVGGSGKTRLALQVATDVLPDFPDGVWWVELGVLFDPTLVAKTVASGLGLREHPDRLTLEILSDHLRLKQTLLVLDNCEHLIDACAELIKILLENCANLQILATSREALGLDGETVWSVPPLALPDREPLPAPKILAQYEAVSLFITRALASQPGFTLTRENALGVAHICQQLEGLPLAIELAAARLNVLSIQQIADRLADRFGLLASHRRAALPQHQTLRATMDWSWELLSENEKALLRRLSVFAGGFTLEAVERVCEGNGYRGRGGSRTAPTEILDLLTHLVEKSLVIVERRAPEMRYRLLETVRQYAQEKLRGAQELEAIRSQHLEWFMKLAERAEPELKGSNQKRWLEKLEQERNNLRAALAWSLEEGFVEQGVRMMAAVWRFWHLHGPLSEGRQWAEAMLAASSTTVPVDVKSKALTSASIMASLQGDYVRARSLLQENLTLVRELGNPKTLATALHNLGLIVYSQGDYEAARLLFEESLAMEQELGDQQTMTLTLTSLGMIAYYQGDYAKARELLEQGLQIFHQLGDKERIANLLNNLGQVADAQGDYATARSLYEESLAIKRELRDNRGIAVMLNNLGSNALYQGDYEIARTRLQESLALHREVGNKSGIALAIDNLGLVACAQGDYAAARSFHEQSLALFQEVGSKQGLIYSLEGLAAVAGARGQPERALTLFGAAEALREAVRAPLTPAERAGYERNVSAARSQLSEKTSDAAWAEGYAMTLEQAIEYALAQKL